MNYMDTILSSSEDENIALVIDNDKFLIRNISKKMSNRISLTKEETLGILGFLNVLPTNSLTISKDGSDIRLPKKYVAIFQSMIRLYNDLDRNLSEPLEVKLSLQEGSVKCAILNTIP